MRETGRVSRLSGTRWYGHATKLVVTGMVLTWTAAGCSSPSAVTGGPPTSCYQFAAQAIQRHVTVAAKPAAKPQPSKPKPPKNNEKHEPEKPR